MKGIDVCCGGRMFYFDKNPNFMIFMDIREENKGYNSYRKNHEVKPDVIASFTDIPFKNEEFDLVVFDPPHLKSNTVKLNIHQLYGVLNPKTWKDDIQKGFSECFRILKKGGILIFKWNESSIKIKEVLELVQKTPLLGNKQGTKLNTHWLVFVNV